MASIGQLNRVSCGANRKCARYDLESSSSDQSISMMVGTMSLECLVKCLEINGSSMIDAVKRREAIRGYATANLTGSSKNGKPRACLPRTPDTYINVVYLPVSF